MPKDPVILHVEDDSDQALLIARTLQKHLPSCEIHLAGDGAEALDYLLRQADYEDPQKSPRPELILLDLRLPKVDGLDVLRTLKTNGQLLRIPVVVLTSSKAAKDVTLAYEYHVNSYLVKPVSFQGLSLMLEHLVHYWLRWNRRPQPAVEGAVARRRNLLREIDKRAGR